MAVQTSQIITATNGNLSLTPNGTGQIVASPLAGSGNRPIGVDNAGTTSLFTPSVLTTGTPTAASEVMLDIGGTPQKATAQSLVDATNAIDLTDLSVTTAAVGTATGALAYDNTTGVFTFTPVAGAGGGGGIALTDLSVTTAAAGTPTGGLSYDNTTGVFTFTPVKQAIVADVGNTPPAAPLDGQLWWDSDEAKLFIYYNDGNTSQWVVANP